MDFPNTKDHPNMRMLITTMLAILVSTSYADTYTIQDGVPMEIPVTTGLSQIAALRTLIEAPVNLAAGDIVRITCRATASNNDLAERDRSVNWAFGVRIEPTPGNNWGTNFNASTGQEYIEGFDGWVSIKNNGNISPEMHHDSREPSTTWTVSRSDIWYIKCVSRAHASTAISSDRLNIDRSQLEIFFID
jgi:hypothetical protein